MYILKSSQTNLDNDRDRILWVDVNCRLLTSVCSYVTLKLTIVTERDLTMRTFKFFGPWTLTWFCKVGRWFERRINPSMIKSGHQITVISLGQWRCMSQAVIVTVKRVGKKKRRKWEWKWKIDKRWIILFSCFQINQLILFIRWYIGLCVPRSKKFKLERHEEKRKKEKEAKQVIQNLLDNNQKVNYKWLL